VNKIYWEEGDLPKIADYCQKDVITISKLFLKMQGNFIVDDIHVEITAPSLTN